MALSIGELTGYLSLAAGPFSSALATAQQKLRDFGPKGAAIAAAAGLAIGGALAVNGIKAFAEFEQGMNEVFTLLPDASEAAMSAMSDDARAFAREFGVLHEEVVPALYQSISAGVPPDNVFDFLEVANKAAVGGVTELSTAVDGISSVVNSYGAEVIDATKASDLMFTAVKLGKTDFGQLSGSLYNVLPIASSLGVEFGDVTAAIAAMTAQGVPTAQATTQIRQAFVELSKDGTKTSDLFRELAGQTFSEFIASGGNTQDALQLLEKHAQQTGVGINDLFGSVEAGGAALALTGSGTEAFSGALAEMGDSAGATETAFSQMDQGLARAWQKIKVNVQDAVLGFGEQLAPAVQQVADWVGDHLPGALETAGEILGTVFEVVGVVAGAFMDLAEWIDANQVPIMVVGGLIAAVLLPHLAALAAAATTSAARQVVAWAMTQAAAARAAAVHSAQIVMMVGRFAFLGAQALLHGARVAAGWVIAMGPVAWVIALVVGLVALIIANWDTVKAKTVEIWSAVTAWIGDRVDAAKAWVTSAVQSIMDVFGWFGSLPGRVRDWFDSARKGAVDRLGSLLDWVRGLPGRILSALGNLGSLLWDAGGDVVRGLWDGIKSMGGWLRDTLIGWAKNIIPGPIARALGISSPSKVMRDDIGRWIPAGIVDGITDGAPALDQAMRDLVDVPSVTVAAGVRGHDGARADGRGFDDDPRGGGGQTFNVYEAASARETAEQVAVIVDYAGGS